MTPLQHAEVHLKDQIGRVVVTDIGIVDERTARRFASATGRPDLRRDSSGEFVVSPLFLTSTREWGTGDELAADGTTLTDIGLPGQPEVRVMGGGQDLELIAPIRIGMRIAVHAQVTAVQQKDGRSGSLLVAHIERRYLDEAGDLLVICRESRVMR